MPMELKIPQPSTLKSEYLSSERNRQKGGLGLKKVQSVVSFDLVFRSANDFLGPIPVRYANETSFFAAPSCKSEN